MRLLLHLFVGIALWAGLASCASSNSTPPLFSETTAVTDEEFTDTTGLTEEDAMSYDQMFRVIREKKGLIIVYGSQEPAYIQAYQAIGEEMQQSFKQLAIYIKSDEELTDEDWESYPIYFLGSPTANKHIAKVLASSPFSITEQGFDFNGKKYEQQAETFAIGLYPNPLVKQMPFSLFSGNSDEQIIATMKHLYGKSWRRAIWGALGYQVFRGEQRLVMGEFSRKAGKEWTVGGGVHWDFDANTGALEGSKNFKIIKHGKVSETQAIAFMASCDGNIQSLRSKLGLEAPVSPITYHLYASSEEKALLMENAKHSHLNFATNEVHTVLNEVYRGNALGKENELVLRQLLGKPKLLALEEGLGIYFAPKWQGYGALYWMARLQQAHQHISLEELFNDELYEQSSELTFRAAAGTMIAFLMEEWGKEVFVKKYPSWKPSKESLNELELKWKKYVQQLPAKYPAYPRAKPKIGYVKGFNFAHEGYRIYNGYGSTLASESINYLKGIHSNAIALVPYSYMEDADKPNFLRYSNWAGGENDEGVAQTAYHAQQQGMSVLLKPQIWFGKGSWPGDLQMKTEEDWKAFFHYYRRWISHYAMLAEIHQMEVFCLGVEFAKATIEKPKEWEAMAHDMRGLFQGSLTYAANWGREAENLSFWQSFDYIGVNCYYPLSTADAPNDEELKAGFEQILERLHSILKPYKRPVLFTEIGFRSVAEAWKNPHAGAEGRGADTNTQARCYRVVCDILSDTPWCEGVYWWKWPSYMSYASQVPDSFSPTGKPAEKVVEQWFKQGVK